MPRIRIAHLPTPVEPLPRLSAYLSGPRLWVKRDDQTGLAFGGNKTRKLEYLLAEAQANGAQTLVTVGGVQSNHCRQTAALAARYNMGCILVLNGTPSQALSGNLLLDELFGAEIIWTVRDQRDIVLQQTFQKAWETGRRPYLVPLGASTPLGSLGYATAFEELIGQDVVNPDWIVVASSSGGTQAGLVLGAGLANWEGKILGISIDQTAVDLQRTVSNLASEASGLVGEKRIFRPDEVMVNTDYLGSGYAILGEAEVEAIRLFAKYEGLLLDPVYTGRAAAGLIDLIRKGFFTPQETVLFWHTGGTPALFADSYRAQLSQPA
ncbi:MAG TPA: D-cysteine desulfhydrase family protein [Longilinea sp.]|nr:D-cysteine desulfhydrase family protein [Longilinea sp.]